MRAPCRPSQVARSRLARCARSSTSRSASGRRAPRYLTSPTCSLRPSASLDSHQVFRTARCARSSSPPSGCSSTLTCTSRLPLQRFESHAVVALADARPWHLADRFLSDGRWRLVLFAGDVREPQQRSRLEQVRPFSSTLLRRLSLTLDRSQAAAYLDSPAGLLRTFTPLDHDLDSVIEVLTVISNPRTSVEPNAFPDVLWPPKKPYGSRCSSTSL